MSTKKLAELPAGTIEYIDSGGDGPVLVFLHGVVMSSTLWDEVIGKLPGEFRCIVPELPLGAHKIPMNEKADLSLPAMAKIVFDFLDHLDVNDVTLINNDWGGSQVLVAQGLTSRIGRLIITSCEAFENYPPGIPGKLLGMSAKLPAGLQIAFASLKFKPARRLPMTWGRMSKKTIPPAIMDAWFEPILTSKEIRRDFKKYANKMPKRDVLIQLGGEQIGKFEGPALVIWAADDRLMPLRHGKRLAELLPQGELITVDDSFTLIPIDKPDELAGHITSFVKTHTGV